MNRRLRPARLEDVDALLAIYEPYVLETAITFEYVVPCRDDFAGRLRHIGEEYPWLVLEEDGRIAGYAYAARHMERAAYQWNAVLSVYVERGRLGHGRGRILYGALLDLLTLQSIRNVYGCVTVPNEASDALHAAFGFRLLGEFPASGYKLGSWHGIRWYGRCLNPADGAPDRLLSVQELNALRPEEGRAILRRPVAGTESGSGADPELR